MNLLKKIRYLKNKISGNEYQNQYILLEKQRAIYIPIPKVGSTSLKYLFAKELGLDFKDKNPHRIKFQEIDSNQFNRDIKHFKFIFVRDPLERLSSCYNSKFGKDDFATNQDRINGMERHLLRFGDKFNPYMSFDEFVLAVCSIDDLDADSHFRSQHTFLGKKGLEGIDFIGKFETFTKDFENLKIKLRITSNLTQMGFKSSGKAKRRHFDNDLKLKIFNRYQKDYSLFGYSLDNKI